MGLTTLNVRVSAFPGCEPVAFPAASHALSYLTHFPSRKPARQRREQGMSLLFRYAGPLLKSLAKWACHCSFYQTFSLTFTHRVVGASLSQLLLCPDYHCADRGSRWASEPLSAIQPDLDKSLGEAFSVENRKKRGKSACSLYENEKAQESLQIWTAFCNNAF